MMQWRVVQGAASSRAGWLACLFRCSLENARLIQRRFRAMPALVLWEACMPGCPASCPAGRPAGQEPATDGSRWLAASLAIASVPHARAGLVCIALRLSVAAARWLLVHCTLQLPGQRGLSSARLAAVHVRRASRAALSRLPAPHAGQGSSSVASTASGCSVPQPPARAGAEAPAGWLAAAHAARRKARHSSMCPTLMALSPAGCTDSGLHPEQAHQAP